MCPSTVYEISKASGQQCTIGREVRGESQGICRFFTVKGLAPLTSSYKLYVSCHKAFQQHNLKPFRSLKKKKKPAYFYMKPDLFLIHLPAHYSNNFLLLV